MTSPPPRLLRALLPLLLLVCSAQASAPRALLALDRVIDGALVAGRNATVHYLISNVGTTYVSPPCPLRPPLPPHRD